MASDAGFFGKEFFAGDDGIGASAGGTGKPRGIVGRLHDGNPATHEGVVRATVLRTKEMVTAGNDVHFHAEGGNEKVVDDVLAGQDQADVAVHGNVQLVYFFQPVGLLR